MSPTNRVLVAEDDPGDALLLKRAFGKASIDDHYFVRDGQEVIDYLSGAPPFDHRLSYPLPRLLLLDLRMPRVSGFEVLEWLRRSPVFSQLPVTVLSGFEGQADIDRAYALGANLYVLKPQDPGQLIGVVLRLRQKYDLGPETVPAHLDTAQLIESLGYDHLSAHNKKAQPLAR